MYFEPNEDQSAFLSVLEQLMDSPQANWVVSPENARFDWSTEFDASLERNGYLDCAAEETLGLTAAVAMVYRLASLPIAVECAASSMLRALYAPDLPRPVAVIESNRKHAVRFLPVAKSVLFVGDGGFRAATLNETAVSPVESLFAYPMGVFEGSDLEWQQIDADPEIAENNWRIAIAAEIAGALKGGLDAVVAYVRERHQFGRPLGSLQSIQHRLAAAAAKIDAAYWLTLRASQNLTRADSALALGYVEEISTKVVYDLHQFMGAMGLTMEHPLHRWTYRVRLLRSSLGGAGANLRVLAARRWG